MARPFGNRTRWTFGYWPEHGKAPGVLTIAHQLYTGQHEASDAADRAASKMGCKVTPPLKVTVEIPEGVKR